MREADESQRERKKMKVLVTGGTGKVGSQVVAELLKRNADVRVVVRKQSAAANLPSRVEVAVGDLLDPVTVEAALQGVDKLFLVNGVVTDELPQALIAYSLAKRMQIKHVVYVSVFRAEQFRDVFHFASKLAVENAMREFKLPFTILRPGYFMQNDLSLKDALMGPGLYPTPIGTAGIAAVDIGDIAEAAAIALTGEGHEGQAYNLVGPNLLSGPIAAVTIWISGNSRCGSSRLRGWRTTCG